MMAVVGVFSASVDAEIVVYIVSIISVLAVAVAAVPAGLSGPDDD